MIIIYALYILTILLLGYIGWSIYKKKSFSLDQAIAALSIIVTVILAMGLNKTSHNDLTLDDSGKLFVEISGATPTGTFEQTIQCSIESVKPVFLSSDEAWFQVKYEVARSHDHPVFIGIHPLSSRGTTDPTEFQYNPAGRSPDGIPKGGQDFSDDVLVGLFFYGEYSAITTEIEFSIYDDTKTTLCLLIVPFPYRWSKES